MKNKIFSILLGALFMSGFSVAEAMDSTKVSLSNNDPGRNVVLDTKTIGYVLITSPQTHQVTQLRCSKYTKPSISFTTTSINESNKNWSDSVYLSGSINPNTYDVTINVAYALGQNSRQPINVICTIYCLK